jgi:hypothetical protein
MGREEYAEAARGVRRALGQQAATAASLASACAHPAALLELLRVALHRQVDQAIDAEVLRHPDPTESIQYAPTYAELAAAVLPEVRG